MEGDDYFQNVEIDIHIPLEETAEWLSLSPLVNQVSPLISFFHTPGQRLFGS